MGSDCIYHPGPNLLHLCHLRVWRSRNSLLLERIKLVASIFLLACEWFFWHACPFLPSTSLQLNPVYIDLCTHYQKLCLTFNCPYWVHTLAINRNGWNQTWMDLLRWRHQIDKRKDEYMCGDGTLSIQNRLYACNALFSMQYPSLAISQNLYMILLSYQDSTLAF